MKQIKVYGERNSGTIYLEWLLKRNFDIQIAETYETGWKHRLAPSKEEIESLENEIDYVCLIKNPYSWLLSMHKRPYMHEELKGLNFNSFIESPYGDYRNPIVMWNLKNKSYLEMGNYAKNHLMVQYEDLLKGISEPMNSVAERLQIKIPSLYKNIHILLTNSHKIKSRKFHQEYYLDEMWKQKLSPHHIEIINQFLDKDLMNKFNYSFL